MPDTVWNGLRKELQEYDHLAVRYDDVRAPGEFVQRARSLAAAAMPAPPDPGWPRSRTLIAAGWSLGGLVAQRLAASGHADAALLLGTTGRFARGREDAALGWSDRHIRQMIAALERSGGRTQVLQQFHRLLFTDEERGCIAAAGFPADGGWSIEALLAGLHYLREEDMRGRLAHTACPILIMHGTADRVIPWGAAEELHAMIPGSELVAVYGAGHVPFLGRENELAAAARRMIDACKQKLG
ncbi:transporter [Paenibacillus abyssi]|uniref:Transporter n=2 Tax=Paenibacillus abyssi TaxID=1340531 RepID=A0A917CMS1_9BACL|nr:transporter [Paenibacillus abyssi]